MDEKYRERYRTTPARLSGWDYGSNGLYFITICTKNRVPYFGEIDQKENLAFLEATTIGQIANDNWLKIPQYAPFVELDEFVIMPDHIHGIIFINKQDKINWETNKFGPQSRNIASIIRGFKSSVKTYATIHSIEFTWQSGYHDRIIRNEKEYLNIRQYISGNPEKWLSGDQADDINFPM